MTVFPVWAWVGFTVLVVVLLVLDLFVFARGAREFSFRRATVVTVSILASLWKTRGQEREAVPGAPIGKG